MYFGKLYYAGILPFLSNKKEIKFRSNILKIDSVVSTKLSPDSLYKNKILSLTLLWIWLKKGQSINHCLLLLQQGQKLGLPQNNYRSSPSKALALIVYLIAFLALTHLVSLHWLDRACKGYYPENIKDNNQILTFNFNNFKSYLI